MYYITDKYSNLWVFKRNEQNELIYDVYNHKKEKIHTKVLARDCRDDFIVSQGENNAIHVILVKTSGDVLYYFFNTLKWTALNLFNLGPQRDFFNLLSFHLLKNQTHIIYSVENPPGSNKWLIVDLYWEKSKWTHLKVFQSTKDPKKLSYTSLQSHRGHIYFAFQWWDGREHQIQLCQYNSTAGLWSQSTLTFRKGDKYSPAIWITDDQILHVCWVHIGEGGIYSLRYRRKDNSPGNRGEWQKERTLYESPVEIENVFLCTYQNKPALLWMEKNNLYYMHSDHGSFWGTRPQFMAELSRYEVISYLSQKPDIREKSLYLIRDEDSLITYPIATSLGEDREEALPLGEPFKVGKTIDSPQQQVIHRQNAFYPPSPARTGLDQPDILVKGKKDSIQYPLSKPRFNNQPTPIESSQDPNGLEIKKPSPEKQEGHLRVPQSLYQGRTSAPSHAPRGMEAIRHRIKGKIIEEENQKLKSEIDKYKDAIQQMQRDLNHMEYENNKLKQEISDLKESTIGKKILNFFKEN